MSKECCEHEGEGVPAAPPVGPGLAFRVHGMDCAEEVATLKRALRGLVPEDALGFDVLNGKMSVPGSVAAAAVIEAVAGTGMRAEPWVEPSTRETGHSWTARDALVVASGSATTLGFGLHAALGGLTAAIGSEGAGLAAEVPWPARAACSRSAPSPRQRSRRVAATPS